MNKLGRLSRPFLFVIDYSGNNNIVELLDEIDNDIIKYDFEDEFSRYKNFYDKAVNKKIELDAKPITFDKYKVSFDKVKAEIEFGNSFLANLTMETPFETNSDLEDLILKAKAKYKLYLKDNFVCFSPESFVSVSESGVISSFPMKGTIDGNIENAEKEILNDAKEMHEHATIVDLIRNDLSQICEKVWVEKYRYIDKINTQNGGSLLQVSSKISGELGNNWKLNIGDWLFKLLPAGSITGAPKSETIRIIKEAEKNTYKNRSRGFYTGIFGIFDGRILTSAVMIRFIHQNDGKYYFNSGGGITSKSLAINEYKEAIQKIYVPVF